jgi:LysM repeat protein
MILIELAINFINFFYYLAKYIYKRSKQLYFFLVATIEMILDTFNIGKNSIVSRLFWGRGNMYRNSVPFIMIIITGAITITGLVSRIGVNASSELYDTGATIGMDDLLQQGGSIETVLARNPEIPGIQTIKHVVKPGETLKTIAEHYAVSMDTIRWASPGEVSPFTNEIEVGAALTIPEINGVLYTVKPGESLDSIIATASVTNSEANRFNILEFNGLTEPVSLNPGQKIFIPDGNLKTDAVGPTYGIPRGVFINPVSHPDCSGYSISRGFLPYHNGVDLARYPGCPIVAVANGYVTSAGMGAYGMGYHIKIDHGGGITTHYYHGDGTFWVKAGDRVNQGDPIMMMGTTGNSTGVHLHFSLFKNGVAVNPYGFVPY